MTQKKPKITLTLKAKIVVVLDYKPKRLNLFPIKDNAGCPQITLTSVDKKPFAIKSFSSTGESITADFDPSVEQTEFVIQPTVDVEKLIKGLAGRITIGLSHPGRKNVTIPFNALARFKIQPTRSLIVFNAQPHKPTNREIWILDNYNEGFEIESVSSKEGYMKVLNQTKVGKRYKLELEITPPDIKPKQNVFYDSLYVNVTGGERLEISCRGYYAKKSRRKQLRR